MTELTNDNFDQSVCKRMTIATWNTYQNRLHNFEITRALRETPTKVDLNTVWTKNYPVWRVH